MTTNSQNYPSIYLDRNENQFGPAPECYAILREATKTELSSYSREFTRGVKSILSETLAREHGILESNLLLGYGSEDMLKQIVHCYLADGETMMIPKYSWWYYRSVAGEVGGNIVEYPIHAGEVSFYYDVDQIASFVFRTKPRLFLIASPNNPTGNTFSLGDTKLLLMKCPDTMFVIDEAYFGFTDSTSEIMPQLTLENPNLAVLRTFSKLYALAGVRIGYACVGKNYQKLISYSARYLGYNVLSEQLALAALRDAGYYRSIASTTAKERERYYEFFGAVEGCKAYRSDANFVLVKISSEDSRLLKQHLDDADIHIKFYSEKEFPDHIRITIGTPDQNSRLIEEMRKNFARKNVLVPEQH